jgi:hypothetical protein
MIGTVIKSLRNQINESSEEPGNAAKGNEWRRESPILEKVTLLSGAV